MLWWWDEEVKNTIATKKAAFEKLCRFPSKEIKTKCKRITNQTGKVVVRAMRKEAEQKLNNLCWIFNGMSDYLTVAVVV